MKKTTIVMFVVMLLAIVNSCDAQPRSNYEIVTTQTQGIAKYHFFLEKKPVSGNYQLQQDMDYLQPDVTSLKIGETSFNYIIINLPNDGSEYKAGVVVEDSAGFYSGMATVVGNVGNAPVTPSLVLFRKK